MRLENRSAMAKSDFSCVKTQFFFRKSPLRCGSPSASPEFYTDLDLSLFYILILGTYSKFARKNNFLSLGVCFPAGQLKRWPQVCRVKITCTLPSTNRFVSKTKISMKCVVNWKPLRICVRSRNTQPHLNEFMN